MGGDNFKPNARAKAMWNALAPGFYNVADRFVGMTGQPNFGIPQAPQMPSMSGVLSGIPMYSLPNAVAPTSQWWNSLAPEVKAGAWAPYEEAADMLGERMGATGQLGSARAGYSGAAGAAFGDYYADAANNYATGLWNMSQPGLMAGYQAQLQQNLGGYQNQLTERLRNYENTVNQMQQDYGGQMTAWQMPWNMMTNYNNLVPSGSYHDDSGGGVMGAIGSIASPFLGMAGYAMGGPIGGMIGGGIGNLFSGWGNPGYAPGMATGSGTMSALQRYGVF